MFKGLDRSEAAEARVLEWVEKLTRVSTDITRCEVLIEEPHRHQRLGRRFHVRVELHVPGKDIVVSHDPGEDGAHDDVYVAIRDAFTAARRQLEDFVRVRSERAS
jgi:ribosome-associated translation inhibitor RaiA